MTINSTSFATAAPNAMGLIESSETLASHVWLDAVFTSLRSRPPRLLINNEWVEAHLDQVGETFDPSTGNVLGSYAIAGGVDVHDAVAAAKAAQPAWAALTLAQRAGYLAGLRERILANRNLLATLDAVNAGLPVETMQADNRQRPACLAGLARHGIWSVW